jgi:phage/plasmid-associated DNA primase
VAVESVIDKLYQEHKSVLDYLENNVEVSLRNITDDTFKKLLVLSAASYFEQVLQDLIVQFVSNQCRGDETVISLTKAKVIDRQYHTYFDWDGKNANKFFALFGSTFSDSAKEEVSNDEALDNSIKAFLELGKTRNALVHLNAAAYFLEKTAEEIYQMYVKATYFVGFLSIQLAIVPRNTLGEGTPPSNPTE